MKTIKTLIKNLDSCITQLFPEPPIVKFGYMDLSQHTNNIGLFGTAVFELREYLKSSTHPLKEIHQIWALRNRLEDFLSTIQEESPLDREDVVSIVNNELLESVNRALTHNFPFSQETMSKIEKAKLAIKSVDASKDFIIVTFRVIYLEIITYLHDFFYDLDIYENEYLITWEKKVEDYQSDRYAYICTEFKNQMVALGRKKLSTDVPEIEDWTFLWDYCYGQWKNDPLYACIMAEYTSGQLISLNSPKVKLQILKGFDSKSDEDKFLHGFVQANILISQIFQFAVAETPGNSLLHPKILEHKALVELVKKCYTLAYKGHENDIYRLFRTMCEFRIIPYSDFSNMSAVRTHIYLTGSSESADSVRKRYERSRNDLWDWEKDKSDDDIKAANDVYRTMFKACFKPLLPIVTL